MDSIPAPEAAIGDDGMRRLLAYWSAKRRGRELPARADIDPVDMSFALGRLALIEVAEPAGQFRIRLQGTELLWWLGRDLTGKTLEQIAAPALRTLILEMLADCIDKRAPIHRAGSLVVNDILRGYETLILPLSADGQRIDMLLVMVRCCSRSGPS